MKTDSKLYCKSGGCAAKLGAGTLSHILEKIPKGEKDPNLLIGYDSHDDAAVYKLTEDMAIVQTLDFFPPMVEDPYLFGQIAATNAMSDIYAMGGVVKTALNIVCFPETEDMNVLGEILRGGSDKVMEAGGSLAGGHSIADDGVKYGLSVTGIINPGGRWANDSCRIGDILILTKRLGTGIMTTAARCDMANSEDMEEVYGSMTLLNKHAAELGSKYDIHACTDVTGFGLLGHLHEMLHGECSARINAVNIPAFNKAEELAGEFVITAGGQKNRNYCGEYVKFIRCSFGMEELLFDPQTSGGLLFAVKPGDALKLLKELKQAGLPAEIIGEIIAPEGVEITVTGGNKND